MSSLLQLRHACSPDTIQSHHPQGNDQHNMPLSGTISIVKPCLVSGTNKIGFVVFKKLVGKENQHCHVHIVGLDKIICICKFT